VAIELGAAYISILPSTDKLAPAIKAELDDIQDEADRSGRDSGSRFGSSFKSMVGNALKGGVLAGLAGASFLGGLGVKTAAEMEQAEIAFTTMLGSADKAKAFIADLNDFAAKTPFEFPGLQTAATSLISAGIATRDVLPIMETLGDVTSGMGTGSEGIQRATVALQQMNAAGKVTGEDLNQLRDAGIPVFDLLSASMGKTKAEIADMAQKGTLGAEGLKAIMDGLKSGKGLERFSGLMEKQSQSLTGMWSTFKDTLGMGMAKAVKPLIPLLKDGLGGAAKALPPIIEAVANGLKKFIEFSIAAVKWGREHKTLLQVVGTVLAGLAAGILAYNAYVKISTAITRGWAIAQGLLNAAMALNPIGLVVAAIVALGVVLFIAWKKSETFRKIVTGALDKVKAAGSRVKEFFTKDIPAAFDKVKGAAGKALGWVKANWPKILAVLTGPIGLAVYAIAKNWNKIKAGAGAAKDWIVEKWDALVGFFRNVPGKISSAASGMWNGIRDSFRSMVNAIIGYWNNLSFSLDIPDKIPGLPDSFSVSTPNIPYLAKGGILTEATLNVAGEAGPEAVIPLDRLDSMLRTAQATGAANAEARHYTNPGPASSSGPRRTEFVITNWKTGEGFFREIAEDTYHGENEFAGTTRRMR
jgi:tape measure domain-containing protein